MRHRLVGLVLGLTLVATGCSDDEPEAETGAPTTESTDPAAAPVLGAWHVLVTDPQGGVLLVNGYPEGATDPGPLELWRWDGEQWAAVEMDGQNPSGRNFAAVAMDTDRDVLVLHGGLTPQGASDETWTWDGEAWSLAADGSDGPGPRSSSSMAYDAATGRALLYGGDDGTDQYNDTWAWDGDGWERVADDGPDLVRWPAFYAFDPATETVVMYGGHQVVDEDAAPGPRRHVGVGQRPVAGRA